MSKRDEFINNLDTDERNQWGMVNQEDPALQDLRNDLGVGEQFSNPYHQEQPLQPNHAPAQQQQTQFSGFRPHQDSGASEQSAPAQQQEPQNFINTQTYQQSQVPSMDPTPVPAPPVEAKQEEVLAPMAKPVKRPDLRDVKIDINKIEIIEKSPLDKVTDIDRIVSTRPTFQVIANQSSYIAHMTSIRMEDINAIQNSISGQYENQQKLYRTIFNKINNSSLGDVNYTKWLKVTSFFDVSTLLYGIYCQTFPTDTDFTVTCGSCNEATDIRVNNGTLIDVKDETVYENLNNVLTSAHNPEEVIKDAVINSHDRVILPYSKVLVEIKTPTLADHLELLGSVKPEAAEEMADVLGTLLFIKNIYVPDMDTYQQTGEVKYVNVDNMSSTVSIIRNLELVDASELANAISARTDRYAINYKIKSHPCSKCGTQLGDIDIDMQQMLFHQVLQM
jgi:hypothetical protein